MGLYSLSLAPPPMGRLGVPDKPGRVGVDTEPLGQTDGGMLVRAADQRHGQIARRGTFCRTNVATWL